MRAGCVDACSAIRIGRFHHRDRMGRYAATKLAARVSLMRHFLPPPRAPPTLSSRMTHCPAVCALIARTGSAQALAPANARTVACAVNPTVIAALADAHLHAAALAVVEPVGRLLQRPQCASPPALDSAEQGRHKGLANTPAKALRTEGPGFDANQTSRAFVYLTVGLASIAEELTGAGLLSTSQSPTEKITALNLRT
jgi:hypothetical protein